MRKTESRCNYYRKCAAIFAIAAHCGAFIPADPASAESTAEAVEAVEQFCRERWSEEPELRGSCKRLQIAAAQAGSRILDAIPDGSIAMFAALRCSNSAMTKSGRDFAMALHCFRTEIPRY